MDRKARLHAMAASRAAGATLRQIGNEWGISLERVRQILNRAPDVEVDLEAVELAAEADREAREASALLRQAVRQRACRCGSSLVFEDCDGSARCLMCGYER